MNQKYDSLKMIRAQVQADRAQGMLDYHRQMVGIGGSNAAPMPEPVRKPVAALKRKMVRVFLQEYFFVYPDHNVFDWSRLDAFMDSLAETGCQVMASICLKPHVLYPVIDPRVFMPNDVNEWQKLVEELVRRYSVERKLVTHWGILNETNIGEDGGCPHEIRDPDDYYHFYVMTAAAVRKAWPEAKVGGPSTAGMDAAFVGRFVELCEKNHTPLDFICYNIYSGDPEDHVSAALQAHEMVRKLDHTVEVYQTELNTWFPHAYVEEAAYSGRYAASLAAVLMELNDTPITGSFQFDMYDTYVDPDDFEKFYSKVPFMLRHWNEIPHRFGLFDLDGRVRPQYFVYKLLSEMEGERLACTAEDEQIRMAAAQKDGTYRVLLTNYGLKSTEDKVVNLMFSQVRRGLYRLEVFRIDDQREGLKNPFAMEPVESRLTFILPEYSAHILLPADSVTLVRLTAAENHNR